MEWKSWETLGNFCLLTLQKTFPVYTTFTLRSNVYALFSYVVSSTFGQKTGFLLEKIFNGAKDIKTLFFKQETVAFVLSLFFLKFLWGAPPVAENQGKPWDRANYKCDHSFNSYSVQLSENVTRYNSPGDLDWNVTRLLSSQIRTANKIPRPFPVAPAEFVSVLWLSNLLSL